MEEVYQRDECNHLPVAGLLTTSLSFFILLFQTCAHAGIPGKSVTGSRLNKALFAACLFALVSKCQHISKSELVVRYVSALLVIEIILVWTHVQLDPLRNVPGPFLARYSRLWKLAADVRGQYSQMTSRMHQTYGSLLRIAPNCYSIVVSNPSEIDGKFGKPYTEIQCSDTWSAILGLSYIKSRQGYTHDRSLQQRALNIVMGLRLRSEKEIDSCLKIFGSKLSEFAQCGESINLSHWVSSLTWDAMSAISMGVRYGFLDKGLNIFRLLRALEKWKIYAVVRGFFWEWQPLIDGLLHGFPHRESDIEYLLNFAVSQIDQRIEHRCIAHSQQGNRDHFDRCLEFYREWPSSVDRQNLLHVCLANLSAVSDKASITVGSALFHLYKNPQVLQTVRTELAASAAAGRLSDPITMAQALKMPYLQAVLKEALRMHSNSPPISYNVPAGGCVFQGYNIPGGCTLTLNGWMENRSKRIFGEDAKVFRPERWLENDERTTYMEEHLWPLRKNPDGSAGESILLSPLLKVVPQVVRRYDFDIENANITSGVWSVEFKNLRCRVAVRHDSILNPHLQGRTQVHETELHQHKRVASYGEYDASASGPTPKKKQRWNNKNNWKKQSRGYGDQRYRSTQPRQQGRGRGDAVQVVEPTNFEAARSAWNALPNQLATADRAEMERRQRERAAADHASNKQTRPEYTLKETFRRVRFDENDPFGPGKIVGVEKAVHGMPQKPT